MLTKHPQLRGPDRPRGCAPEHEQTQPELLVLLRQGLLEPGRYVRRPGTYERSQGLGYPYEHADAFPIASGASYTLSYRVKGYATYEVEIGQAVEPYAELIRASSSPRPGRVRSRTKWTS